LNARLRERHQILEEAAAEVQEMSAGSLRAAVLSEDLPEEYVSALFEMCKENHIRDLRSRCEEHIRTIAADGWQDVLDCVLEVFRHKLQTGSVSVEPEDEIGATLEAAVLGSLTAQQLSGIYSDLDDTRITKMLTAIPESHITFEYKDVTNFIPFEQASPGQQAAALLHLLLNQEAGTLVIDQPEEDLDNKVIMKIVGLVQKTKQKRQIIYATHNPNFVVNGDADKVVALTPGTAEDVDIGAVNEPRISIEVDGAIETPLVRSAITETMEGGQAAFELRSRKYQFMNLH
jgi:ABC-type dipeptide/oligopeptide/nickel transport system ATPase component